MSLARFAAAGLAGALLLSGCSGDDHRAPGSVAGNHAPSVDAGPARHASVGQAVILQAAASDPDGDAVEIGWTLTAPWGSRARLALAYGSETAFAPDVPGAYFVAASAWDGELQADPALVVVTVGDDALPDVLVAYAGPDQRAPLGPAVQLDGTGSADPTGYPLDYAWEWVSRPDGSTAPLDDATKAKPAFTPDFEGTYVLRLTVTALAGGTATDEVTIAVVNAPPSAAPGGDRDAYVGDTVTLAAGATDPDGETIRYAWTLASRPEGSAAALDGGTTATATLAPDVPGFYVVSLAVSDPTAAGDEVTITIRAAPPLARLAHRVVDAAYAAATDRIVMIDDAPNALYVYDPATGAEQRVLLALAPAAVSVSPDGLFAAVAHDAYVSYVDLTAATVLRVIPVSGVLGEIVLAGNGYAYAWLTTGYYSDGIRIVNVATGAVTSAYWSGYPGKAALHPGGAAIYSADYASVSPQDLRKLDISGATTLTSYDSPYHGDYPMCGNLWISEDGARIFTACGNVFRATSTRASDMTYAGKLEGVVAASSVAESAEAAEVLAIPGVARYGEAAEDTVIRVFEATYLTQTGSVPVSPFLTPAGVFAGHARHVFYSGDGTRRWALVQADPSSALVKDFGVMAF